MVARLRVGNPPHTDLIVVDSHGRHPRLVAGNSLSHQPPVFGNASWSPDGQRLVFDVSLDESGFRSDLYIVGADGSKLQQLTQSGDALAPVWSPDGRSIVYARHGKLRRDLLLPSSLWEIPPDGDGARPLTPARATRSDIPGGFSPDGTRLVFTRTTPTAPTSNGFRANTSAVYVMNADGSGERKLADRASDPAFSPDGRHIAFVSERDHNGTLNYGDSEFYANELYVMRSDGSAQRRLTHTRDLNEKAPSWLSSGTRIAYGRGEVTGNAEGTIVIEVNANGSCPTKILADPRLDTWYIHPAWRPGRLRTDTAKHRC